MLVRISCRRCRLASLWTDEPRSFLGTVCHSPKECEARLVQESFSEASTRRAPRAVEPSGAEPETQAG
ncbi:MAG: hypothetical protein ACREQ9_21795 [Candidatus Binatia bacterium]